MLRCVAPWVVRGPGQERLVQPARALGQERLVQPVRALGQERLVQPARALGQEECQQGTWAARAGVVPGSGLAGL